VSFFEGSKIKQNQNYCRDGHAQQVEEQRRDVGERGFDQRERSAPDEDHGEQEQVRDERLAAGGLHRS